jgi:hypothetical protein
MLEHRVFTASVSAMAKSIICLRAGNAGFILTRDCITQQDVGSRWVRRGCPGGTGDDWFSGSILAGNITRELHLARAIRSAEGKRLRYGEPVATLPPTPVTRDAILMAGVPFLWL